MDFCCEGCSTKKRKPMTKEKSPLRQKDIRTGAQQERERIIALLEQHQCTVTDTDVLECWCGSFNEAVALIKGENE